MCPAGEALQQQRPGVAVVKAFNTTFASRYADPAEDGVPVDVFLAGDDPAARQTVGEFAGSLGFRVIDAGRLRFARSLEEMAFLHICLNAGNGWPFRSAWTLVGPTGVDEQRVGRANRSLVSSAAGAAARGSSGR